MERKQAQELAEALQGVKIFHGMSPQQIATVVGSAEPIALSAGEPVFREGDPVDGFYLLVSGSISVRRQLHGRETEVASLEAQTAIGESGMIGGDRRMASCVAATDCLLYKISRSSFDRLCASGSAATVRLVLNIASILRARLDQLNRAFVELSERAARGEGPEREVELEVFRRQLYTEWMF
ncbi:MAG: cyclic nucleotide-binding domain-containing protein [Planctomycetota bacterium]|nr:MAG: cyclic nucleotide-binding domain-containing protein [Planctomycetota bacterium]